MNNNNINIMDRLFYNDIRIIYIYKLQTRRRGVFDVNILNPTRKCYKNIVCRHIIYIHIMCTLQPKIAVGHGRMLLKYYI